ncbi:carbohydrate ABC transporter permease [Jiangella asiatica]|uniref:carbohydrate ABC transporter permease n=1 Tax=Jiangella asiatica TaxID=2530372 RepID=UPI0013A5D2AE|nr:carbohydrate ABC transporter permease [Jiangella asiatica]
MTYAVLALVALTTIFPVLWMLYSSIKPTQDILRDVFAPPTTLYFGNFDAVLQDMLIWVKNSVLVTGISLAIILVVSALAAYAFSQLRFRGRELLFVFMLVGLMVPAHALVVAGFKWISVLGIGGILALILTYGGWSSFGILVMRSFFDAVPKEIIEAARMDGASHWKILTRVLLPLARPGIATVTIFTFLWVWNDFVYPLVYLQRTEDLTVPIGILSFQSRQGVQWGPQMATLAIATIIPLVAYLIARRQFVRGIMQGAVKG